MRIFGRGGVFGVLGCRLGCGAYSFRRDLRATLLNLVFKLGFSFCVVEPAVSV